MPKTIALHAMRDVLEQIVDPSCSSPVIDFHPDSGSDPVSGASGSGEKGGEGGAYDSLAVLILPGGELIAYSSYGYGAGNHPGSGVGVDVQAERDTANVLAGVVSEAWAREIKDREEGTPVKLAVAGGEKHEGDGEGMEDEDLAGFSFESELGRIYVCGLDYDTPSANGHNPHAATPKPIKAASSAPDRQGRYLLFGICAPETVPVNLLRAKANAVRAYLSDVMADIGPKAANLEVKVRPARGPRRGLPSRNTSGEIMA